MATSEHVRLTRLLTFDDLEREYGIPRATAEYCISRRQIPFVRLGPRLTRFDREEIDTWIESQKVQPHYHR